MSKRYGKAITVRIPTELHDKVLAKEKRTGVRRSHIVRLALEKWVRGEKA